RSTYTDPSPELLGVNSVAPEDQRVRRDSVPVFREIVYAHLRAHPPHTDAYGRFWVLLPYCFVQSVEQLVVGFMKRSSRVHTFVIIIALAHFALTESATLALLQYESVEPKLHKPPRRCFEIPPHIFPARAEIVAELMKPLLGIL